MYNKTSIKRNILTIKQNTSEAVRAKDLSAPLYMLFISHSEPPIYTFRPQSLQLHWIQTYRNSNLPRFILLVSEGRAGQLCEILRGLYCEVKISGIWSLIVSRRHVLRLFSVLKYPSGLIPHLLNHLQICTSLFPRSHRCEHWKSCSILPLLLLNYSLSYIAFYLLLLADLPLRHSVFTKHLTSTLYFSAPSQQP